MCTVLDYDTRLALFCRVTPSVVEFSWNNDGKSIFKITVMSKNREKTIFWRENLFTLTVRSLVYNKQQIPHRHSRRTIQSYTNLLLHQVIAVKVTDLTNLLYTLNKLFIISIKSPCKTLNKL